MGQGVIHYWTGVGRAIQASNANEQWWDWWRSGPLRGAKVMPGGRAPWATKSYHPPKFKARGSIVELGLTPKESELANVQPMEATKLGHDAVHRLVGLLQEHYEFQKQHPPAAG